jgi:CHAT domain-containing protein
MSTAADKADARLRFAIEQAEKAGDLLAWIDSVVARYERQREREAAPSELAQLRNALAGRVDDLRAGLRSRVGRFWASAVVDAAFGRLLVDVVTQDGAEPAEVFRLVEATKARTLLDALGGQMEAPSGAVADRLAASERELLRFGAERHRGLVFDEMRLTSELALGQGAPGRRPREALTGVEEAYREAGVGFSGVEAVPALEEVIAALEPGELLLEFVLPHHPLHPAYEVWVVAVHHGGAALVPGRLEELPGSGFIGRLTVDDQAPVDASPLGNLIIELRAAIQRGDDAAAEPALRLLDRALLGPLADAGLDPGKFDRVTIVPHRLLHPVPWAALTDPEGRRLIERTAVALAPSAAVWLRLRRRAKPLSRSCLALANPPLSYAGADPLPAAEDEVARLTHALEAVGVTTEAFVGPRASETTLVERASGRGIVYLATHGAFPEGDALDFHNVLLARTRSHDGILSAEDVRRLDLTAAWLVVLSICDGGLYRFGPGDEPQGLLPAFFLAAAENVVATLWEIDDSAGRDFMARAGPHLVTQGPAEALRRAAADALDDPTVPIRDWAGFVVTGTGAAPQA